MFLAHGQSTRDDGNYPRQLRHDVADKRCTNQSAFATSSASQATASQSAQSASPDSESCQDDPDENAEHRLRPNDPKTREDFPEPERGRSCEERTFSADVELAAFSIESGSSPPKTPTATTSVSMATGSSETTKQTKQPTDAAATSTSVAYFEFDEEDQLADELEEDEVVEDLDDLDDEVDEDQEAAVGKAEAAAATADGDAHGIFACHLCTTPCPQCDYKCRTSGRLRRHVRDFHSVVPPPTYTGRASCPKVLRCKQCDFTAEDKTAFWSTPVPKCPFVTEYKHHLEYHIRNHFGSKPYKCGKCNYQCVNRSMLNSHLKSHTNVYQHRCRDCGYASKYCHSLRQHLRKYGHQPAATLNPDGSMPEEQAASAAKSRRRQQEGQAEAAASASATDSASSAARPPFSGGLSFPFGADQSAAVAAFSPAPMPQLPTEEASATHPLDPKKRLIEQFEQLQSASTQQQQVHQHPVLHQRPAAQPHVEAGECRHCGMLFRDSLMYHLHMAFHSRGRNPFRCGRCGVESRDRLEFFIHLARSPHL
uniref:Protein hunchback n=1 Tax=Macrostomum lignano TaxID=282301 RepID=A0A1I8JRE3_9PLAT